MTITSVAEYVEAVCTFEHNLIRNGLDINEVMLFRGHADINYQIIPWIGRGRNSAMDITIFNEERNLIDMAKYKMPSVFRQDMQPLELLALLQHYGIPTRLLDVTENALVALYFACCSEKDKDGEVIVFKHNERNVTTYPLVNAVADTYRLVGTDNIDFTLESFLDAAISQPYFTEQSQLLKLLQRNAENRLLWIEHNCSKPIFVYAPIHSMRQQIQRGRYILFPNKIGEINSEKVFEAIIEPISKEHECVIGEIGIKAANKEALLYDLRAFGISREALFADSIDEVCRGIVDEAKEKGRGRKWTDGVRKPLWN